MLTIWGSKQRFCDGLGRRDFPGDLFDHGRPADLGTDARLSGARSRRPVPDQGYRASRHRACYTERRPGETEQRDCLGRIQVEPRLRV